MSEITFQELQERIDKNDNRGTAKPYLLLLQEKEKYVAHPEYNHNTETVWVERRSGDYTSFKSEKECLEWVKNWYEDPFYEPEEDEDYEIHEMGHHWKTVNVFLTDKGYEEHLDQNRHNLRDFRSYGIHAFRNPEIKKMFEAIESCASLEKELTHLKELIKKARPWVQGLDKPNGNVWAEWLEQTKDIK